MKTALINTNCMKPPIAPIGLEYVAENMRAAGHDIGILDLCFVNDPLEAIRDFFSESEYELVGLSLRNSDDCAFSSKQSFLGDFKDMVSEVRKCSDALVIAGGVGFSVMPERILEISGADAGIWAEGEFALPYLADQLKRNQDWRDASNLVWKDGDQWKRNPPTSMPLSELPFMKRDLFDNPRYFREGGQAGFETKRGCPMKCTYCADPLSKGKMVRTRPPEHVATEIENLLSRGIDHFHTCDAEFNIPEEHAKEVCREFINRGLGDKIRWYAYCSPKPFSRELSGLMKKAGCVGINFGTDTGDAAMLQKLGRSYSSEDIITSSNLARDEGMAVMLDLLIGAPGETRESIKNTIDVMRQSGADRIGVTVGVRLYPGTSLTSDVLQDNNKEGLHGSDDPLYPMFFIEPALGMNIFGIIDELIGEDERFLFFDPNRPGKNYNYNANEVLVNAIKKGHRGAYWDILRKLV